MSRGGAWVSRAWGAWAGGHQRQQARAGHGQAQHQVKGKRSRHQGTGHQRQQAGKASTCKAPGRTDNRAQAGTAPGQRQAAKPQGTGTSRQARHRARASGHASGHRAASGKAGRSKHPAPAPAAGAGHQTPHRQGQHRAPGLQGQTGPHRTRSRANGQTASHRHQQAGAAQGTGKPGRTGGIDPGGSALSSGRRPPDTARARPAPARHRTRASRAARAARAASIRAGWHPAPSTQHPAPSTQHPAPSRWRWRWRWPSGTAQVRPAPGTGLQRQTGPHRSGPVSPQHPSRWRGSSGRARASGPHQVKGKRPKRKAPGTGHQRKQAGRQARHRVRARASRAAQVASIRASSTKHPAAGAGAGHQAPHTPQRLASHTQRVSSAADKGAKGGHFSRPFPGPCVRVRWRGIEYRTRANSKAPGAPCRRVDSRTANTARKRQNHGRAVPHWNKTPKPGTSASDSGSQGKNQRRQRAKASEKGAEYM